MSRNNQVENFLDQSKSSYSFNGNKDPIKNNFIKWNLYRL